MRNSYIRFCLSEGDKSEFLFKVSDDEVVALTCDPQFMRESMETEESICLLESYLGSRAATQCAVGAQNAALSFLGN